MWYYYRQTFFDLYVSVLFMLRSSRDDWIRYLNQIYIVIYNLLLIIQSKFNNFLLNLKEEEVFLTFLCLSLPSILSNDISWHAKLLKVLNNLAQFEFTLIIIVPKCKNHIFYAPISTVIEGWRSFSDSNEKRDRARNVSVTSVFYTFAQALA